LGSARGEEPLECLDGQVEVEPVVLRGLEAGERVEASRPVVLGSDLDGEGVSSGYKREWLSELNDWISG
jgi:hypothetical protein